MVIHCDSILAAASISLILCACTPGEAGQAVRADTPKAADALGEVDTICRGSGATPEPLIVDWRAHERANLEQAMARGVAVVKYDCEGIELLKDCRAGGAYGFIPVSRKKESVKLNDADEIRTNLPLLGPHLVANFGAEIQRGMTLDLATILIGKRTTTVQSVTRDDVDGSCDGATHFVRGAFVGAFAMKSGTRGEIMSEAQLFGAGVEGRSSSSKTVDNADGEPARCEHVDLGSDRAPAGCSAMIRLELLAISPDERPRPSEEPEPPASVCPTGTVLAGGKCTTKEKARAAYLCDEDKPLECKTQCEKGQAWSCLRYAFALQRGTDGITMDVAEAGRIYRLSCDGGAPPACYDLAIMHRDGRGVATNEVEAVRLFRIACDAGMSRACNNLGVLTREGRGVDKDEVAASKLYRRACDAGTPSGCSNLGTMYDKGGALEKDEKRAFELYKRACEGGRSAGCNNLANMYRDGRGVAKDEGKAVELYRDVCARGEVIACDSLGNMYRNGQGVAKDEGKAVELFRRACDGGGDRSCKKY